MYGEQRLLVWTLLVLAAGTLLAAVSHTLALLAATALPLAAELKVTFGDEASGRP